MPESRPFRLLVVVLALVAGLFGPVGPLAAQSDADLRGENQALTTQVNDLKLELAAARARIAELERMVSDLEARLAAGGSIPVGTGAVAPPAPPEVTIDESFPTASPRTLLAALRADYVEALGEVGGWSTAKQRTLYFKALEKWIAQTNRRYRAPIEWQIRLDRVVSIGDREALLRGTAIDPGNGVELGGPFEFVMSSALLRRLEMNNKLAEGEEFILRGTLTPKLVLNDRRETVGAFDSPPFIGPFSEFGFGVQATSLARVPAAELPPAAGTP